MKITGKEKFLIIATLLLFIFGVIYFSFPGVGTAFSNFSNRVKEFAQSQGYLGAFVFSTFGNTSIMIPIPYPIVILFLAAAGLNPILLGIISGVGAVIGESVAFYVGRGGRRLISEKYQQRFEYLHQLLLKNPHLTPLFIYFFAATPLPDDVIMIPLGMINYRYWKVMVPCFLGKTTFLTLAALSGNLAMRVFSLGSEGGDSAIINFAWTLLLILIIYLILKIDWGKFIATKDVK